MQHDLWDSTWRDKHTHSFSANKKLGADLFSFVRTGCVVLAGLWILFFIAAHLLLEVEQRRQYFDNLRLSEPESTGEERKSLEESFFIRKQTTVSSTLRRSNVKYLSRNIFSIAPSELAIAQNELHLCPNYFSWLLFVTTKKSKHLTSTSLPHFCIFYSFPLPFFPLCMYANILPFSCLCMHI